MNPLAAIAVQNPQVPAADWTSDRQPQRDPNVERQPVPSLPPSREQVEEVADAMSAYMASLGVELRFHVDDSTDRLQVEVRDPQTDKLIRKIPPDDILRLAAAIEETVGVLVDRSL
ncbi:hypothetical protein TDMWS_06630 [Thermodesulfomicrobium sp. WS]|uniref:flagellar protein FlaG n=1 Tax=Thermodesulfomicrobium sp. WS TaxID=3004129 RepID=UPI002492C719|nr:flagellar protein FlaG [Thermodesulfomicrobium sp. WS]BDV00578.1 hypothetical protein TDMWS_06630 [Thermodesulfomicrobium sp. WS]